MIPVFPEFKRLELSDKAAIEKHTSQFPPYSDFNFTSMWAWDIKGEMVISELNGNLVVRFADYLTGEPFYSFLGTANVADTIETLLIHSEVEKGNTSLKLVPEECIHDIDSSKYIIKEERDHFDYIYRAADLTTMEDSKLYMKRKHFRFFHKNFVHTVKHHHQIDPHIKGTIIDLYADWVTHKGGELSDEYYQSEFLALSRFLAAAEFFEFAIVGIYIEEKLVAVSISEPTVPGYNVSHFQKAINSTYKGLNTYLVNEVAKLLHEKQTTYINWEQDLGVAGLRENKESYLPCKYLKKYSITRR